MFQRLLRLGCVEMQQHPDAASQAGGHGDFRGPKQRHVGPAEPAGGASGILGSEVRGRGEDRALDVFRREGVRLLKRGEQLLRRLENRLTRIGGRRGRSTEAPHLDALRPHLPAGFLLGLSVGSPEEAARAPATADYWSVGPCFATPTKGDAGAPLGPEDFASLARLAPEGCPVIGIGGITSANAGLIKGAGAVGVAVIGVVLTARDPESATRELNKALQ